MIVLLHKYIFTIQLDYGPPSVFFTPGTTILNLLSSESDVSSTSVNYTVQVVDISTYKVKSLSFFQASIDIDYIPFGFDPTDDSMRLLIAQSEVPTYLGKLFMSNGTIVKVRMYDAIF